MAEYDVRLHVAFVHLADKLATPATRRKNVSDIVLVLPDRDDAVDLQLSSRNHRGDRAVLGAEAGPGRSVDAYTDVYVAGARAQSSGNIAEEAASYRLRMQNRFGSPDEFLIA